MARQWSVNNTPATCAVAVFTLKTLLKVAGWTVTKSSDGTTYNSGGDQISSGSSGANGMDNAKAWFVIKMPGVNRSFCLQRTSSVGANTSYNWRIKYSASSGFSGGSPGILQTPSAADEKIMLGGGTDAAPSWGGFFAQTTDGAFRYNAFADDTAPYGFLAWNWTNTTGANGHAFGLEPVADADASDTDPYIGHLNASTNSWTKANISNNSNGQMFAWIGASFYSTLDTTALSGGATPEYTTWGSVAVNAFSGKDELLPIMCFRNAASPLYKGILSLTRGVVTAGRVAGDLFTVVNPGDYVVVSPTITLPWPTGTTPTI
jgi:hypothetical protein